MGEIPYISINFQQCHKADVELLGTLGKMAADVAHKLSLPLHTLEHAPKLSVQVGIAWSIPDEGGIIFILLRYHEGRKWKTERLPLREIVKALAHAMTHLRHTGTFSLRGKEYKTFTELRSRILAELENALPAEYMEEYSN